MKRILSLVLALIMCLTVMTSCEMLESLLNPQPEVPTVTDAELAIQAITTKYYGKNDGASNDYTLEKIVVGGNTRFDIQWSVDLETIQIKEKDDRNVTVDLPDDNAEEATYVLTAKIVDADGKEYTKSFTLKLPKYSSAPISIEKANSIGAAQGSDYTTRTYMVAGVVTKVANETYGNIYISDGTNEFYIYGLYDANNVRYDKMENQPKVGDYIVVSTVLGQYKGAPQGKNATLKTHVAATTLTKANEIGAAQGSDYTAEKYIVTGVVDEIANSTYGNVYIKDADGNRFYIYGLYDAAGVRFDKLAVQPAVGDTITVLTALGQYKGAAQGKNGTIVAHTVAPKNERASVTYTFASTSTQQGVELTNETALALFTASGTEDVLTSVSVTKIYDGNGTGGAYPNAAGFLKAGTGKVNGQIVLDFGDRKVVSVEIKCHDWYKASAQYPTNSNKVSVNGCDGVLAPYNESGAPEVMTFTLDGTSSVVTIDTALRIFIFEIVVVFAE
jgi:hypothetical protein